MAITTDRTITIHGVSVGVSKPIQTLIANGDFTYAELSKFAIVGRHDFVNNVAGVFEPDNYYQQAGTSAAISELEKYPVLNSPTAPGWDSVLYTYFGSGNRSYDNYGKMVLIYDMVNSDNYINKNFNDNSRACIVTEFNPRLIKMLGNIYTGTVNADAGETGSYTIYEPEASRSFVWMDDDTSAPFSSLCIQNFGDAYYFDFPLYNSIFNAEQTISGNRDSTNVNLLHIFDDYMSTGNKLLSVWCDGGIDDFLVGANYGRRFNGIHDLSDDRGDKVLGVRYVPYGATVYTRASSLDTALKQLAGCGFYFDYDGTTYKPIAEGGIVTGYTADLDKNGEWDLINDVKGNTVPDTPGGGGGDDNPFDVDPETYGWAGGEVSGMVKYYLLTAGQMGDLQSAIASNANWTIDYLNCVVSCFVVPNTGIFFDAPIPTTVKFKLDDATKWDTGVACSRIQGTINKSGGTIAIPRLTNTFYDFEPYSDYSVYIPFCGRVPIKGNVCLGREISVTYYPDVPTCSLTAVVSCGGATIAIAKGSFGTMTPVTSNGSDRKTAAVIGDVTPILTGIGTGIAGAALGNPLLIGAGAAQALGGIMGGVKDSVQSYAYSVGSTGDSSFFGAGNRCYYYANYPLIDEVVNNSMFGHTVGYLCNTVGQLSGFKGFTVCANPHVTFSATAEERDEIERLLSIGVIL